MFLYIESTAHGRVTFVEHRSVILRSMCPTGQSLGSPTVDLPTLLWITEVLNVYDLEFPILLDESEDEE